NVVGDVAFVAEAGERLAHHLCMLSFVIDDEDVGFFDFGLCHLLCFKRGTGFQPVSSSQKARVENPCRDYTDRGRWIEKTDPLPTSLLSVILPPCSSTIRRVIASPSPVPPVFVE